MTRRRLRTTTLAAVLLALATTTATAGADDTTSARVKYEQATQAYKAREYAKASSLFAEADSLSPSPVALEAALRAAMLADDPVRVLGLVKRASRRNPEGSLAALVAEAKSTFGDRVGKLLVTCPAPCSATVDGEPLDLGRARTFAIGHHLVELQRTGEVEKRLVRVVAGKTVRVDASAPEQAARAPTPPATPKAASAPPLADRQEAPEIRGLSPVWFWAAAGTTVALGAATIASAVDTASIHDAYETTPTLQGAADGKAAQTRTHALLGFTGGALAGTAIMGIFAVRWSEPARPPSKLMGSIAPLEGGAAASVSGRF